MFTKVCGLTTKEQIDKAIAYGYDAIGIVTYPKSKRFCPHPKALELAAHAKGKIKRVVVGKTYDDVKDVAHAFDYTQIHESRQVPNLVLALKEIPPPEIRYDYFIYDASIGSGTLNPFPAWVKEMSAKIIVAGGLNPENVCSVIKAIRPFGVDVSSGVEKDGVKDFGLMKAFIDAVKNCWGG
jgi:phosphoribosylanthranilate isomerase